MPGNSLFSLDGRIALVTGASQGLGLEIALGLARAGAHVLVNSRSAERTDAVAERIQGEGLSAEALPFDVADGAAAHAAFDDIAARFGRLDIFVHNVGERFRAPLDRISTADFAHILDVDLTAAFTLTKRAGALMVANNYGRIIFVTSIAGTLANRGDAAYIAAKAGLTGLMRAFATEYGAAGVTCNAIAPGPFATESNADVPEERIERVRQRTAIGRRGNPSEIAGPAVFLASEAASYVNAHVLTVDAGYSVAL
ncbi:MAG TPA: SDR family oxidoreductase [Alphaproteobacteria bacterium]|nr:SDR family oxidoreductase [Alphaproteobacteria bacterium]